jgi:Flp pilus assembly protein TadG
MFFRSRRRGLTRRAVTAVEFAVVAPVLFMMILGLIEVGRACMVNELLTEAARQGCRIGIIEGTSSATIQNAATNYLSSVGINGETASVVINDAAANSIEASTMPAYTEITVQVSVPASSVTWTPTWFLSGTISSQYTMRRE